MKGLKPAILMECLAECVLSIFECLCPCNAAVERDCVTYLISLHRLSERYDCRKHLCLYFFVPSSPVRLYKKIFFYKRGYFFTGDRHGYYLIIAEDRLFSFKGSFETKEFKGIAVYLWIVHAYYFIALAAVTSFCCCHEYALFDRDIFVMHEIAKEALLFPNGFVRLVKNADLKGCFSFFGCSRCYFSALICGENHCRIFFSLLQPFCYFIRIGMNTDSEVLS